VNKKNLIFCLVWQFWKRRRVWAVGALAGLIPRLHSTSETMPTTAHLLLDHMAPKIGHSWLQWIIKSDFLAGLTILKKETCLGILSACGLDPAVALRLRNAADYCLPTFGPHGTKLGHSRFQWKTKNDVVGWFNNSEKGDVSEHFERLQRWSRGCTPSQEHCRLPRTYFYARWHQTRSFLIAVNNKKRFSGWFANSQKEMCLGILNGCGSDPAVPLPLRNAADHRLPTFGPHGTKLGHSWFQYKIKGDFLAGLTILKKEICLGIVNACGVDPVVALHLRNAADYRLPNFRPPGTKLGPSWFQWKTKSDVVGWFDNSEKGDVSRNFERLPGLIPWLHSTSEMLQTTAYLLLGYMAPKKGFLDISE